MNLRRTEIALFAMLAVGLLNANAVFAWSIDRCDQVLDQPGNYTVTADVGECGCSGGPTLSISASHVHLNTAGHNILGTCAAVIIADGVSDVRIDGGGAISGGNAVIIGKDKDVTLAHLGLSGDSDLGGNGTAVEINGASEVKVADSTIGVSCEGFGIMGNVDLGTFSQNIITAGCFTPQGITLDGSNNVIRGNTINLSSDSTVGFSYAISVTKQSLVEANTIKLSGFVGTLVGQDVGINLAGDSNRVRGNTIVGDTNAALYGIFAAEGAVNNTITRNSASGNQFDLFDSNGPPCVNTWKHNKFQASGGAVACIN